MKIRAFGIVPTAVLLGGAALWLRAETMGNTRFRVDVNMVVLSFTVTDNNGKYVSGLKPEDIRLLEDNVQQQINSFSETAVRINTGCDATGNNVLVLFDTSNCMYEGLTHAQDAIAAFIRSLPACDRVAVYGFSRNLSRGAPLTTDRFEAIRGLHSLTAGDETALYNALLLVLREAAPVPGRKMVVVFSNGPDNASVLAPDDVRRVAEEEGIPIYVVSTRSNQITDATFARVTGSTGGKLYIANRWQKQTRAFEAIREDLSNSYTVTYYPEANPNHGFRKIKVEIVNDEGKRYRIRARPGYRPKS